MSLDKKRKITSTNDFVNKKKLKVGDKVKLMKPKDLANYTIKFKNRKKLPDTGFCMNRHYWKQSVIRNSVKYNKDKRDIDYKKKANVTKIHYSRNKRTSYLSFLDYIKVECFMKNGEKKKFIYEIFPVK